MSVLERDVVALCAGAARCDVVPQAGGAVAGFWWEDGERRIDWLKPARAADVARADGAAMACLPLVPWAGRIRGGSFRFAGTEVDEGRDAHDGHGWRQTWRIIARSAHQVVLDYRHAGGAWPWPYRARETVALADGALSLTLEIVNESGELMPAGLGFRTVLPAASKASLVADAQGLWTGGGDEADEWRPLPPGADLACVAEDAGGTVFTGWSGSAAIAWPGRELCLAAEWPLLSFLAVRRASDLALAPMSQCADAFNLARAGVGGTGLRVLAPGAGRSATIRLAPRLYPH
jgi:aldose 1-epimerase